MLESRFSDNDVSKRDVPSFIEPRPPLISNPFMRPRPQKGTNLMELFEEDSESDEPELVQVYLRLKPCNIRSNLYEIRSDRCLLTSLDTTTAGHGRRTQHNVSKMYTFSYIFGPEATQTEIFENVVKDNLRKLPDGHNFTLLTYGASGSGKTYTLMGTVACPGLVPRSLEYVFRVVEAAQQPMYKPSEGGADKLSYVEQDYELQWVKRLRQVSAPLREKYRRMSTRLCENMTTSTLDLSNRTRYYIWVSFIEIYNEGVYDLLAPGDRKNASKLVIREDSNGTVYVKGATQAFVRTGEEAYDVMVAGKHNLQVAATGVHAQSSRSHCIFTITMLTHTEGDVRASYVRLCDLAGSERARRTRNTGARMQESRAINSSLHVLERCLHTLRRPAARRALVPYRESKLTRLLGAGLSGAKGEAVSMVVTLNPSPEYAHETRHVLQLAAVARDIQINNTMSDYPSTLESSQDTTLSSSMEVLKLRAENERLHFELIQAEARNKELTAYMERRQAATAHTMREVVAEAKDITRQNYEMQLQMLQKEMEEMVEDYENRLSKVVMPPLIETQSKSLQNKITELMAEMAILEEKLNAEILARARAEEEVQHLRACIEERDEKLSDENASNNEDVISVIDSDNNCSDTEEDPDPCNESLEPIFTKEYINQSRLINQSLALDQHNSLNDSVELSERLDDSILEKSFDTIKDTDKTKSRLDEMYADYNETDTTRQSDEMQYDIKAVTSIESLGNCKDNSSIHINIDKLAKKNSFNKGLEANDNFIKDVVTESKETYSVNETDIKPDVLKDEKQIRNIFRGTYCVPEPTIQKAIEVIEAIEDEKLAYETNVSKNESINSGNLHYKTITQDSDISFSPHDDIKETAILRECEDVRYKDAAINMSDDTEVDKVAQDGQWEVPRKASEPFVNKILNSLKSIPNCNSSLAQFEQLEKATRDCQSDSNKEMEDEFCNIEFLNKKRNYFDDIPNENYTDVTKPLERRTYFNNISVNLEKGTDRNLSEVNNELKQDDLRYASIAKEEVTNNFEPSTINTLLRDSVTCQPEPITSVQKKKVVIKKNDSMDMFDSPQALPISTTGVELIKQVRDSIENIIINENAEIKTEIATVLPTITITQASLDEEVFKNKIVKNKQNEVSETSTKDNIENIKQESQAINSIRTSHTEPNMYETESNNTIEEFSKIYNDITTPRVTDFELLVNQTGDECKKNDTVARDIQTQEQVRYNLRNKSNDKTYESIAIDTKKKNKNFDEVVLLQSTRNLRLRRRKNKIDDEENQFEEKHIQNHQKFKDIVHLQSEFSDVTIDVPAPVKITKDIPSPEKMEVDTENLPPVMEIQSCPSKRIPRSRRKLFTPRAEPLEESVQNESGERVRVPRPSYQRPRARRRL